MSLHQSAANLLHQLDHVVRQLTDDQFKKSLPVLSNSTLGQHVRHTLEFFICLIESRNEATVNYDNRRHDPFIEQEILSARNVIKSIQNFLANGEADRPMQLQAAYEVTSEETVLITTTFFRELAYCLWHAVHHMALMKVGLKSAFTHVTLPEYFGVASSTVRHQTQTE